MRIHLAAWPIGGQFAAAGFAAAVGLIVYQTSMSADAAAYFAVAAGVSMLSTVGSNGQRRLVPRALSDEKERPDHQAAALRACFRAVARWSLLAAVIGAVVTAFFTTSREGTVAIAGLVAIWVVVESYRGVVTDAHLGLGLDTRAAVTGDGLRSLTHAVILTGFVAGPWTGDLLALIVIGLVGSSFAALLAALSLRRVAPRGPELHEIKKVSGGRTVMTANLAAALTTQASIITATFALDSDEAAGFALAIRVASALTLVQGGTAKFVLPRVTGLPRRGEDAASTLREIRRVTALGTAATLVGLIVAVVVLALLEDEVSVAAGVLTLGVGYLLNIAAGPSGTVLIANHLERPVLVSNVIFGVVACGAPLLSLAGLPFLGITSIVGAAVACHHGTLARVVDDRLGVTVGLWRAPRWFATFAGQASPDYR